MLRTLSYGRSLSRAPQLFRKMSYMGEPGEPNEPIGMPLKTLVAALEQDAPLNLAESWDNVGLLVQPAEPCIVRNMMLTNDLTENVLEEAIRTRAQMIISYHPPIFRPMKTITQVDWKGRLMTRCLKHEIAVYSPHTTWDRKEGGVNDWLALAAGATSTKHISETRPGRLGFLQHPQRLSGVIHRLKKSLGLQYVRVAVACGKSIEDDVTTMAVCAGSGATVLSGVAADFYLTGEMSHHEILDAVHAGIHVILTEHSNSERGFLRLYANEIQNTILRGAVRVYLSTEDVDPLGVV